MPGNGLAPSYNGSSTNPPWALQFRKAQRPVKVDLRGGFWWEKMLQQRLVCFLIKMQPIAAKEWTKKIPQVWELVFTFLPALQILNLNVASSPVSLMYHH